MGNNIDVCPEGVMLLMQNKDIPGVVGKVGGILGKAKINIGEYILSRSAGATIALSVIKIDEEIDDQLIKELIELDEIIDLKQIHI